MNNYTETKLIFSLHNQLYIGVFDEQRERAIIIIIIIILH